MSKLNWKNPIQVRLNEKDLKIIEEFISLIEQSDEPKLAKVNQSEFIRICITFTIVMITYFMNLANSKAVNKILNIQNKLVKDLAEGKTDAEVAKSVIKFTQSQLTPLIAKDVKEISEKVSPLAESRKAGAPKKPKRIIPHQKNGFLK